MSFPSSSQFVALTLNGSPVADPVKDVSPDETDIVGSAAFPAAYYAYDGINIYFRLRLSTDPRFKSAFRNFAWGVLFDTDNNPSTYEWELVVNGLGSSVDLIRNTVQIANAFTDQAEGTDGKGAPNISTEICNFDIARAQATGDGSTFGSHENFFIDWLIPASSLLAALGITSQSTLRFAFFTATNNNNFNKDFTNGTPQVLSQAFCDPVTIAGGDIRAKLALAQTVTPQSVTAGAQATFSGTITASNTGRSGANLVIVSAPFQFDKLISFPNPTVSTGSVFVNMQTRTLTWSVGVLNPGQSEMLRYQIDGMFTTSGSRTINTVTASGSDLATGAAISAPAVTATINVIAIGGIAGTVLSQASGLPLPGVTVKALLTGTTSVISQTTTDTAGVYSFTGLPVGSYNVQFSLDLHQTLTSQTTVTANTITTLNATLIPLPSAVQGVISASSGGGAIPGAAVIVTNLLGAVVAKTNTNAAGQYTITGITPGNYRISFSADGFQQFDQGIKLSAAQTLDLNISLLSNPGAVTGIVTSTSGTPIAGALVEVLNSRSNLLISTTTDASGSYLLNNLPPDQNDRLRVSEPGFNTSIISLAVTAGQTKTVNISLSPITGQVSGIVTDGTTGAAIPNASIRIANAEGLTLQTAMTDSAGAYTITSLSPGSYSVFFGASGYALKTIGATVLSGQTITLNATLEQLAGAITGTVKDVNGNPLSAVNIRVFLNNVVVASVNTDTDGTYEINQLASGKYLLSTRKGGYSGSALNVTVIPGQTTIADFVLPPEPASISGNVTDTAGNPLAGAVLSIQLNLDGGNVVFLRFLTQENGQYVASNLIAVPSIVSVSAAGFQSSFASASLIPGQQTKIDFSLAPDPGSIAGTVLTSDGLPIEGAAVQVHSGNANGVTISSLFTDPAGSFVSGNLAPGVYTIVASASSFQTASAVTQVVSDAASPIVIRLAPDPGSIQGIVTDSSTGAPLTSTIINVKDKNGLQVASTLVDNSGQYIVNGLPPGAYTIVVNSLAHQSGTTGAVVVSDATTTVDFALLPNPGMLNVLTEPVVSEVTVNLYNLSNVQIVGSLTSTEGKTQFLTLAAGSYYLIASGNGYTSDAIGAIITPDQTTTVTIPLVPLPGKITGHVLDNNGLPIPNAIVKAINGNETVRGVVQTGADGSFILDLMPSGQIELAVSAPGYSGATTGVSVGPGQLIDGVEVRLLPNPGSIAGQVVDAVTQQPIRSASIELRSGSANGLSIVSVITDPSGGFVIDGLQRGSYAVVASAVGYGNNSVGAVVASDQSVSAVIALTPSYGRIEGSIADSAGQDIPASIIEIRLYTKEGALVSTLFPSQDGTFVIDQLRPGEYLLNVSATGFTSSTQGTFVAAGTTSVIRTALEPEKVVLRGTVSNAASGVGIAGAQIEVRTVYGQQIESGFSDETGAFSINGIPLGNLLVTATAARSGSDTAAVVATAGQIATVFLQLTPTPGSVFGLVSNFANGANVAGATIRIFDGVTGSLITSVLSGSGGQYSFEGLAPGSYTSICSADGFGNALGGFDIGAGEATKFSYALIPLPGELNGKVTDVSNGISIPGCTVVVRQYNNFGPVVTSILTDSNGVYDAGQVTAANYVVSASQTNFIGEQTSVNVASGSASTVDFTLKMTPTSIEGTVSDGTTGNPLPDTPITVIDDNGTVIGGGVSDSGGHYEVPSVPGGGQTVVGNNPDTQPGVVFLPPSTPPAKTTVNLTLKAPPLTISGSVRDELTGPVPGAIVTVLDPGTNMPLTSAIVDETGRFTARGLRPGTFTTTFSSPLFGSVARSAAAGGDGSVQLSTAFGTLTGTIRNAAKQPLFKALVEIVTSSNELIRQTISNQAGQYTLTNLTAGIQNARFSFPGKQTVVLHPEIFDQQVTVLDVILFDEEEE
ncbi:carboxypeptidase regulatory-like domain-containing protein [Paenibacillus sp. NPDC058071]|uniref:carboxypeptidase regulatory-like domain-containing protein n=1 Tax=Paenibacillus sp. NPDC058071 TaxID=3346326 RepID=UPI0036D8C0D9